MSGRVKLRYVGAVKDSSGYAAAARGYINALLDIEEIDLTVRVASFENQKTSHGDVGDRIATFVERSLEPKIQITHLTPENFPTYRQPDIYNIGYIAWETERLPNGWSDLINLMDEVWVPSVWNKEVFETSGVTKPIYVVPHVIDPPSPIKNETLSWPIHDSDAYVFYSIFQWIERKNPYGLLKAYFTEFTERDKVYLALKTYRLDCSANEKQCVKNDIEKIKKALNLPYYPPIVFFGDLLTRDQIQSLHQQADCYILLQRGEGFGIPIAEAMSYGKPTISTRYGGCLEYMNEKNSLLVSAQRSPVSGMLFGNYNGHMVWAEPDIMAARKHMRYCYDNRATAKKLGLQASEDIKNKYNSKAIGSLMFERLKVIQGELNGH